MYLQVTINLKPFILQSSFKLVGFRVSKKEKLCLRWRLWNKRRAGRRHNYLYIRFPGDAFSV